MADTLTDDTRGARNALRKANQPAGFRMMRRPYMRWVLLNAIVAGLCGVSALAQSDQGTADAVELSSSQEVAGLVLGLMISPLGHEFLARFNESWSEKQGYETISLNITERFSRRAGSRIAIIYNGESVYAGNIPLRSGLIRSFAAEVAEKVHANVAAMSLKTSTQDPDIAASGF